MELPDTQRLIGLLPMLLDLPARAGMRVRRSTSQASSTAEGVLAATDFGKNATKMVRCIE